VERASRWLAIGLVASSLITCGPSEAPAPVAIPADALPGEATEAATLDAEAVAIDAIDVGALESLLAQAGFVVGSQRAFAQLDGGRQRALVRVLVFERAEGARRYLGWLDDHVDEVIGDAERLEAPDVRAGRFLAVHDPSACCPKATRVYLAAWTDAGTVVTLEVGGDGIGRRDVDDLAVMLDAAI
jgi:hypothetical protein